MNLQHHARLWANRAARGVCLLPHGQVELVWDRVVLCLRRADLIVLHRTLRHWLRETQPAQLVTYRLSLNGRPLFVEGEDLQDFCAMVADVVEQMPRQFVHWADLRVDIVPFTTESRDDSGFHSFN